MKRRKRRAKKKVWKKPEETGIERLMRVLLNRMKLRFIQEYEVKYKCFNKRYDFLVEQDNKMFLIEVDGDFVHARYYYEGKIKLYKLKAMQRRNVRNDKIKNNIAKSIGLPLFRVWGSDLEENPEEIEWRIRKFMTKNFPLEQREELVQA